jgi:hypothetical protein
VCRHKKGGERKQKFNRARQGEEKETENATVWSPFKREPSFRLGMMFWMHVHGCSPLDALHSWVYTDGGTVAEFRDDFEPQKMRALDWA